MTLENFSIIFLILSFIIYGTSCFCSHHMKDEFDRFKIPKLRLITGVSQIILASVLAIGFYVQSPWLIIFPLLGFLVMMFVAILVRIKIKDGLVKMFPAILYFCVVLAHSLYVILKIVKIIWQ